MNVFFYAMYIETVIRSDKIDVLRTEAYSEVLNLLAAHNWLRKHVDTLPFWNNYLPFRCVRHHILRS